MSVRPYQDLCRLAGQRVAWQAAPDDRERRMQIVVDLLWDALHDLGVSWVGFYLADGTDRLVLGPSRDTPACSPIGLHGVCGRGFTTGTVQVVRDVADLGEAYVACDPRDRSEIVLPLLAGGVAWGVLDLDSHAADAFDDADATGLADVLDAAGLC